ncbi:MAG: DNA polymerase III subunit chi [Caldimonas sp.]
MTEISFHVNVASPAGYACRLARKALGQGRAVTATGPAAVLAELDRALWTFSPADFVAHAWAAQAAEVPASLHASTLWLAPDPGDVAEHDVLVNLGDTVPRGFESFARLVEVVGADESGRLAARGRWKAYRDRGYRVESHEAAA